MTRHNQNVLSEIQYVYDNLINNFVYLRIKDMYEI